MMKDGTPETQNNHLPPCPFSVHCRRLLEDLDKNSTFIQDDALLFADNEQDRQLLMQLRTHIPGCPTCTSILSHARIRRFKQRQQIHRFLLESEQKVPSSTTHIIQAIARERRKVPEDAVVGNDHNRVAEQVVQISSALPSNGVVQQKRSARRSHTLAQNLLAFVAVLAVIAVSFSLFNHMLVLRQPSTGKIGNPSKISRTSIPVSRSTTWSSVIITVTQGGQKNIIDLDAMTGKSVLLASSHYADATTIDGISHDGYQVLYHAFDGRITRYYLRTATQNAVLYTLDGKGGPALWSTDDSSVFISTPEGIEKVDVNAHTTTLILSAVKYPDLRFYRDGYLYFVARTNASTVLNRINITTGQVTSVTGQYCQSSYDFWLSTSGTIVYYRCQANPLALYGVGSDGTGSTLLRANVGSIIGYDAVGEPLTLLKGTSTFQVVKLNPGANAQPDQTIIADTAPGASYLAANNVAVAPYGFSLLALARYSNGVGKLWYDDLAHQKQIVISTLSDTQLVSSLQIGGWARLQVPASSHVLGR